MRADPAPSLSPRPTPAAGCVPSYLRHASSIWPALPSPVAPPSCPARSLSPDTTAAGRTPSFLRHASSSLRVRLHSLAPQRCSLRHSTSPFHFEVIACVRFVYPLRRIVSIADSVPPRHPEGLRVTRNESPPPPDTPRQRVRTAPGFLRLHRPADAEAHPAALLRFSDVQHGSAFSAWFSAVLDRVVPTPSSTPRCGPPSGHTWRPPVTQAATDTEQRPFFPRRSVSSSAPPIGTRVARTSHSHVNAAADHSDPLHGRRQRSRGRPDYCTPASASPGTPGHDYVITASRVGRKPHNAPSPSR